MSMVTMSLAVQHNLSGDLYAIAANLRLDQPPLL